VCKKLDWCLVAEDGSACICARTESGKRCGDAGWLHRLADPFTPPPPGRNWTLDAKRYASQLDVDRKRQLCDRLRLPVDAFDVLPLLGFRNDPAKPCFTFPEMDANGTVIGINRRFSDGTKKMIRGGSRGLTLPHGWRERPGPVCVVEGPTDAAALSVAGVASVGRPSNSGGAKLLDELFTDWPADRDIHVIGENDRKPDGCWPGRDGAMSVAKQLAVTLNRPIRVALPPANAKDARDWLTADTWSETPWPDRGAELLGYFQVNAVTVAPPDGPSRGSGWNEGPDNPHRLAGGFLASLTPAGEPPRLRYWRGEFIEWERGAYSAVPDGDIRARLTQWVRNEFIRLHEGELATSTVNGSRPPRARNVTQRLIGDVGNALCGLCLIPSGVHPPTWIDGATGPDPPNVLSVANGLLDLASGRLLPPSASFFTFNAVGYGYNPDAPCPRGWEQFLLDLWPGDFESINCLQEWFGYLLTPDTRQQKLLFMVGPKRAGKGTIARVLKELIGERNFTGPTLNGLTTNFGLSPLLGKSVAVIDDARLSGRADSAVITERLLTITGEGTITVDRKNRAPVDTKLTTRFVILSNELPRLEDSSGALAGRMILLRLTQTFFGSEDPMLTTRLLTELPGILNWAVEGWRRLRERGLFMQPRSGAELMEEMEDLSSPVGAFVRERCVVEPSACVEVGDLFRGWKEWCEDHGRKEPGTEQTFGCDLRAVVPSLTHQRLWNGGKRKRLYLGIRLRGMDESDQPIPSVADGSAVRAVQGLRQRGPDSEPDLEKHAGNGKDGMGAEIAQSADCAPHRPALFPPDAQLPD
jgi:putative DNA primase/helicase